MLKKYQPPLAKTYRHQKSPSSFEASGESTLTPPDLPPNEQARLQTLRSLGMLDTEPEERFDRLTRMAKRVFDVPIALVTLVDENRQWFKSCVGLSRNETPRDVSFCGHAILHEETLIIPNALEDKRFADNRLVVGDPEIRFYAGCPLRAPNGQKMGTLCIIDRRPRTMSDDDIQALKDLGSIVERELAAVQLAILDELTGIPNRRGFMVLAQQTLQVCTRENIPACLVFMDLDKFKSINDTLGHLEGDRALAVFAEQMKASCRSSDVIGRLSGDEFVALLVHTSIPGAERLVDKLRQSLARHHQENEHRYSILFSHGIVRFDPANHPGIDALLADADTLMYQDKGSKH